ncbi:hypothetical protein LE190_11445 [Massilia oculi]|uniref:Uncharacterized protein n=1 Tax=Massilia hydrophila TaxID=3044279 RepID=A0ABS7YA23_9BURK|nr:hypothetical protein [Massilia oculi]MCA1856529.1 hypothetical protein [Massilia oculi]
MRHILKAAAGMLVSAADGPVMRVLRKGAALSEPFHVEFRSWPDGWR